MRRNKVWYLPKRINFHCIFFPLEEKFNFSQSFLVNFAYLRALSGSIIRCKHSLHLENGFYFIPSSESSAYLKQIKCILSAVKKYRIFSLVTDTIFIFSL